MRDMDNLGFVPIEEIQNIFTTDLSAIEADIRRNGVPMDGKIIFEWFDGLKQKLYKRAKWHIDEYVRQNPIVKEKQREEKDKPKANYKDRWEEKVKASRAQAVADSYK